MGCAISCSRGASRPRHQTRISCLSCNGRGILHHCATWEAGRHHFRAKCPEGPGKGILEWSTAREMPRHWRMLRREDDVALNQRAEWGWWMWWVVVGRQALQGAQHGFEHISSPQTSVSTSSGRCRQNSEPPVPTWECLTPLWWVNWVTVS